MINIPSHINKIYESANSLIYRGLKDEENRPVILKVLKENYPTQAQLSHYRQEYEIISHLNITGVIKTYGLENYQNALVIILEDFGGESLKQLVALPFEKGGVAGIPVPHFLSFAIQLITSLGEIHAANIIHKDLNPSNIVVNLATNQLKIIDFSIATRLSRENPTLKHPKVLEGTLAYMSPEQTGRMNCALDYRTDFYSLGVTFYEVLTGGLPFQSEDALELVHCHLAKEPQPVCEINPKVPTIVSDIVMKLLAKTVEYRYQSAFGLKADLENCLAHIDEIKTLNFKLGQKDFSSQFQISEKLYGRDKEVRTLLRAFERVIGQSKRPIPNSQPKIEMVLVTGYSGVGKSTLINELQKPITAQKGYFITGKYDQHRRNIPYFALTHAFNEFCQMLMSENDEQVAVWKQQILAAVGSNGQVLIDVIPNLQWVIGTQPPVALVGPQESQNRFNRVFQNFIKTICNPSHPIVMFIDNWQWADMASLNLLKVLMTAPDIHYFLLIGAYRDNEVKGTHPFLRTLEGLRKQHVIINAIKLKALYFQHINSLIADALHCSMEQTHSLAELIYNKTQGNAFFTTAFLKTLYEEALLVFDFNKQRWQWDLEQISQKEMTNNVVELMVDKIQKFPPETRTVLTLAANVGNQFNLKTLAVIYDQSPKSTLEALWQAVAEGLIISLNENYKLVGALDDEESNLQSAAQSYFKFQHDSIQQAASALVPDTDKPALQLKIGRLLWADTLLTDDLGERVFDIVNLFNGGYTLIIDETEKELLARLNWLAGKKAKEGTAYQTATNYLALGIQLLSETAWDKHYEMAFALHKEQGECEFLCGQFKNSEQLLAIALVKARSKFDKANIYVIKLAQLSTQGQYYQAVATTLEALQMFGLNVPTLDQNEALQQATADEIALFQEHMTSREIDDLGDLPLMQNEDMKVCSQLIAIALDSVTIIGVPDILALFTIKMLNMSIEYGLSTFTPFGYLCFAIVQSNDYRDYDSAYQFASLALQLNEEKLPNPSIQAKIYHLYAYISALREPLSTGIDYLNRGYRQGLEVGDFVSVGYVLTTLPRSIFLSSIEEGLKEAQGAVLSLKKINNVPMAMLSEMMIGFGKSLQGETLAKASLNYENFTEAKYWNTFQKSAPVFLAVYKRYKLQLLCLFNFHEQAFSLVRERTSWIEAFGGVDFSFRSDYYLYAGITCAALYCSVPEPEKQEMYLEILNECIVEHKLLSEHGEIKINFYAPYLILKAEKAKIENNPMEAMHFYDEAIAAAGEQGYWGQKALASELAAQFWLTQQKEEFAMFYLKGAHYAYGLWGASAKVADLEEKYPQIFLVILAETGQNKTLTAQVARSEDTSQSSVLDFASVLKASQMLAAEIELSRLLEHFIKIVIESAGAARGVLLLEQKGQWMIEAEGTIGREEVVVLQSIPATQQTSSGFLVPPTLINSVAHTQKSLVLYDASQEEPCTDDPYVVAHQVKSALCTPLLNKGRVTGLLYLENPLIKGAFTSDRLEVLDFLSSQIAISIENARLYSEAQENERTLKQFLEAIPVGVSVLDADGKPYYVNKVAQHIFGKGVVKEATPEQFTKIYQVYLAGTDQLYPSENLPLVRALQRGEYTSVDNIEIHQGGQIIPIENRGAPIFDDKGNIVYAIAAFQEITERKQAEAERERFTNELQGFNRAYQRFVPHEFLSLLDKQNIIEVQLGDQVEKEMTILFADICGFTSLSEKMTPQENFNFLNTYLGQMEPIIAQYHGFIDKYIGDTIMALFPTSADDAVQAALGMLKTLVDYNQVRVQEERRPINIGIGLNSGHLMLGTVGGQNRMDGTVISDAVNLASHVKGLAKMYGTPLLITMQTYQKLQNPAQCHIRVIDAVKVKGKSDVVTVYEIFEADLPASMTLKNKTMSDFEQGFMLFHLAKFGDAKPFFEKVLEVNENDKVAQSYLKRCEHFQQVGVPEDWEVIELSDKGLCSE